MKKEVPSTEVITRVDKINESIGWFVDNINPFSRWLFLFGAIHLLLLLGFRRELDTYAEPIVAFINKNILSITMTGSQLVFTIGKVLIYLGFACIVIHFLLLVAKYILTNSYNYLRPGIQSFRNTIPYTIWSGIQTRLNRPLEIKDKYTDFTSTPTNSKFVVNVNNWVKSVSTEISLDNHGSHYWRAGVQINFTSRRTFIFHLFEDDQNEEKGKIKWLASLNGAVIKFTHMPEIDQRKSFKLKVESNNNKIDCYIENTKVFTLNFEDRDSLKVETIEFRAWDDDRNKYEIGFKEPTITLWTT